MKIVYLIIIYIALLAIFACKCTTGSYSDTVCRELIIVDSIGTESDSLRMLGIIGSTAGLPNGDLLVLDTGFNNLRLFSQDGEVEVLVSKGSGPGFLQHASEMVLAGDRILIIDRQKRSILRYDIGGNYLNDDVATGIMQPYGMYGLHSGNIVTLLLDFQMDENNEIELFIKIAKCDENLNSLTEYYYRTWSPPYDQIYTTISTIRYVVSSGGTLYLCKDPSVYSVIVMDSTGSTISEISRDDIERVPLSDSEIEEIRNIQHESLRNEYLFQGENEPSHYKSLVRLAGVDSLDRVWVWNLQYIEDNLIHFDIWNQTGELEEMAEIPWPDNREPVVPRVDSGGVILTTNEEAEDVKIYRLVFSGNDM